MTLDVQLVKSSFEVILLNAEEMASHFYDLLFERYPVIEPLFDKVHMPHQKEKLIASLRIIVASLEEPAELEVFLRELGGRHKTYGVKAEYYPAVGECLLAAMERVSADSWSDEIQTAWTKAYSAVSQIMIET